jgi:signal transduction histidine kinase
MAATAALAGVAPARGPRCEVRFGWGHHEPKGQVRPVTGEGNPAPDRQSEMAVLATVAHELRGPLTALATSSELLAEDFEVLDPDQVRGMLSAIHRRTLWLQGLVENLLAAATIREGRLQLHRQPVLLSDLIADVKSVVDPLLIQRGQRIRLRGAQTAPSISVDSRRLGQVLVNLILNASKFGKPGSAIDVTVSRLGSRVRVCVADRGPGVAPDQVQRLFEPYYRSAATADNVKEGVGLGLSIVKSIVQAHGGAVGVESRRGGGARFWFELPSDIVSTGVSEQR